MHLTKTLAALGLAATGLAVATTTPAVADDPPSTTAAAVTTDEQGCHETQIQRAVTMSSLRPLVPTRYGLFPVNPAGTTGRITATSYTCAAVSVDGQPVVGRDKTTTVTIGSARVNARDGQPLLSSQGEYILWYGTDNPVLFAKLQQTGLPVVFLRRSTGSVTSDGVTNTVDWSIAEAGLDYTVSLTGPVPATDPATRPETSTTWWFDGPKGDLKIIYTNHTLSTPVPVNADFTANAVLKDRVVAPAALVINGGVFQYIQGGWTSDVSFVPAP
jgi:hypothetical protein